MSKTCKLWLVSIGTDFEFMGFSNIFLTTRMYLLYPCYNFTVLISALSILDEQSFKYLNIMCLSLIHDISIS